MTNRLFDLIESINFSTATEEEMEDLLTEFLTNGRNVEVESVSAYNQDDSFFIDILLENVNRDGFIADQEIWLDSDHQFSFSSAERGEETTSVERMGIPLEKNIVIRESLNLPGYCDDESDAYSQIRITIHHSKEQAVSDYNSQKANYIKANLNELSTEFAGRFSRFKSDLSDQEQEEILVKFVDNSLFDSIFAKIENNKLLMLMSANSEDDLSCGMSM